MQDIFELEMKKPTIFQDRNVLSPHYIPEHLPYRDKEIEKIMKILAPALSQKRPNNLFIYGKPGTGKTASTKHVLDRLERVKEKYGAKVESLYINCRVHNTKYQVLLKCAETCYPNENFMGHAATHLYEKFLKLKQVINELKGNAKAIDGDIVRITEYKLLLTPKGVKVAKTRK